MAIVKYTIDLANPPKTPQESLDRYDAIREEDIDYSDIPDMGDLDWSLIRVDLPLPAAKPTVTIRLDDHVIRYFKRHDPKGYTGRMAAVLAAYVRAQEGK